MKAKVTLGSRLVLGLIFVVFGLNGFLQFIPMPPPEGDMATFLGGLMAAKYFFPLLKLTEIICGIALLAGVFVPLALIVLAPIVINIVAVHLFLDMAGLPMAILLTVLTVLSFRGYWSSFEGVLKK